MNTIIKRLLFSLLLVFIFILTIKTSNLDAYTVKEDKENYEHQKLEAELADYRDKRRRWADEFNRRRQQGM